MQNEVKVLIAEDEPNALAGLAELISGWGYRTETARDGMEAWEKALAMEPGHCGDGLEDAAHGWHGPAGQAGRGRTGAELQHGRGGAYGHGVDSNWPSTP